MDVLSHLNANGYKQNIHTTDMTSLSPVYPQSFSLRNAAHRELSKSEVCSPVSDTCLIGSARMRQSKTKKSFVEKDVKVLGKQICIVEKLQHDATWTQIAV